MDETKEKKTNSNQSMKHTLSSLMDKRRLVMTNLAQLIEAIVDSEEWEDLILET